MTGLFSSKNDSMQVSIIIQGGEILQHTPKKILAAETKIRVIRSSPGPSCRGADARQIVAWCGSFEELRPHLLTEVTNDEIHHQLPSCCFRGCDSPEVKVSDHGRHVMSSSPVPLKTRRVGQRCPLNLSRAETSSRWCGVVVRRGGASSDAIHVT
ncbi:uncharacterized protein TNCV_3849311 [Trichonephila clavipes]|uniref:Uncharacterized protein n=1 Tax=Trichonephila clavipes TaxID=2585209 RepID=A0A8X6R8H2_TRICX|nr:uncharacterized protein TNCV_3849311 [Trichonephila clavipes]